jgi:purine-binding chemotaxis protein CheW
MTASMTVEQEEQLVAFRLAGETYGIPIMLVHEIIRPCEITRIPRSPEYVRGVVNLRGKIVPVIDLRRRLALPIVEETGSTRIIVVEIEQGIVGMIVDGVSQVIRLPAAQIEPPSDLVADVETELVLGVGKLGDELVILLDIPKTLHMDDHVRQFTDVAQAA